MSNYLVAQPPIEADHYGYKFGDTVVKDGKAVAIHPGDDLNFGSSGNAEIGAPMKPMSDGEVIFAQNGGDGWGNVLVIWHPRLNRWTRNGHLNKFYVKVGQQVKMSDIVGEVGKTGTGSAHDHFEIIKKKLPSWLTYPNLSQGWTLEKVKEYWENPREFIERVNKEAAQIPAWAQPSVDKAIAKKIALQWDNPQEIVGNAGAEDIFFNLGAITEKQGNLSKVRLIVAADRLNLLN